MTPDVHSSRMANFGRWYTRRAMPRRCCSPAWGRVSGSSKTPTLLPD